jgi:hypothetical protein
MHEREEHPVRAEPGLRVEVKVEGSDEIRYVEHLATPTDLNVRQLQAAIEMYFRELEAGAGV